MTVVDAEPLTLDTEQRFSDMTYWRRLGEEHGSPLIVTGSVRLLLAPPALVQHGPRTVYIPTAGRVLEATVVLIDGRTGTAVSTQKLPSRMRYGLGRFSSGLSLYLQLMDRAMPDWYRAGALEELRFIRKAQSFGFSLDDVGQILQAARAGRPPCSEVLSIAEGHIAELDRRIEQLTQLRSDLRRAVARWRSGGIPAQCASTLCALITEAKEASVGGSRLARSTPLHRPGNGISRLGRRHQ